MLPECWAKCRYEDGLVWQSPCVFAALVQCIGHPGVYSA